MFTKTFLSSLPRFKSGTLKKAPSNLKKLPQIAQLVKPTKPPKAFLKPHPEATSVNHLQGFFVHQDKYFYLTDGGVVYYHDGTRPLLMHATQFRKRLMRNFYAAKNMSKRGGGVYGEVLAHWSQYKHFVEEAGSVNAEVRHELRGIDYYDDVSDLSERVKSAIKKLIGGDKTYFERKIKEFEVLLTNAFFLRQNKILPSDFENLKKQSYECVEYDLDKRGYDMFVLSEEIKEKSKVPLSDEQIKIRILEQLRYSDIDTLNNHILDYHSDLEQLCRYPERFDTQQLTHDFMEAFEYAHRRAPELENANDSISADTVMQEIFDKFNKIFKEPFTSLLRDQEDSRLEMRDLLKLYAIKYVYKTNPKDDPLGLYRYFIDTDKLFRMSKYSLAINGVACLIGAFIYIRRINDYEKKNGVLIGNRSRYWFSTEEQFKGEHH